MMSCGLKNMSGFVCQYKIQNSFSCEIYVFQCLKMHKEPQGFMKSLVRKLGEVYEFNEVFFFK